MRYNFDTITERKGTNSLKYDFAVEFGKQQDVIPLWVADMDFQTAPEILARMKKAVEHGVFGYSDVKEAYFNAVAGWYQSNFGWQLKQEWLVKTPGVVFAIAAAIRAYTKEGDAVLIQQPVYYPFRNMIRHNQRVLVNNSLKLVNGHYEIDFIDFEQKIIENHVKMFILCSPHNPVGRVWQEWELRKMGDICVKHQVIVVSDEIHSDFTYEGHKHLVFSSLSPEYADRTVTCTAPSKTFNLAGLQASNIFIPNEELRSKLEKSIEATGYDELNIMGLTACQAAYEEGGAWLGELKEYLAANLSFVRDFLREYIPEVHLIEPEGTYLIWLDFRELGRNEEELQDLIENKAKLWLDRGVIFGEEGAGFERINLACPRQVLKRAMEQLKTAIHAQE